MPKVVSIRFHEAGKSYHFDPGELKLHIGEAVIVETSLGTDMGYVIEEAIDIPPERVVEPLRPVLRHVTDKDMRVYEEKKRKEAEAFEICLEKIEARKLEMHLVSAEFALDEKKIVFFFTADGRVDFRELVKDLAAVFRIRIELRQIGARDQARMVGGLGLCGRELCCCTFLDGFVPVSIKMAKEQGLSMNPSKISGACGRLMCCLKYEQHAYEDALARLPRQGDQVNTQKGKGTVISVDLLREKVSVRLEYEDATDLEIFAAGDVEILMRKGKKYSPPENQNKCLDSCGGCCQESKDTYKTDEEDEDYNSNISDGDFENE